MNLNNERKAFEEWIKKEDPFMGNDDNQDCIWAKKYMWKAWLASANREGYKLVPLEPTERMLDSAYSSISDNLHYADLENIYTAMIGACDEH